MRDNNLSKRYYSIYRFIAIVCVIMCLKIIYLNVIEAEKYTKIADNSIYKDITIQAPRGEIRDKNGVLLAGNKPVFTVKISKNAIEAVSKNQKERFEKLNDVALNLSNILIKNNESIEDTFPIIIEGNKYKFAFDEDVQKWKSQNNIPLDKSAKESFYLIADNYINELGDDYAKTMSPYEIQQKLNNIGCYPPISIKDDMEFTRILEKKQWLYNYSIKEDNISAKEAFDFIRKTRKIDKNLSDEDARKIMVIIDLIESKGFLQYEPALISKDISQKTVSSIQENIVNLPGVSVQVEPLRYYPQGNLASHILGQIGIISSQDENYLKDERYSKSDYIGKSGVEAVFEKDLKGTNGYEKVLVDSMGKKIKDISYKEGIPGNCLYLSIDAKLQKVAEMSLEKTLKKLQTGGVYESKWGNMNMGGRKIYTHANSGAIVALDVNTGKVLAMASYPSYDPNIFTNGLTKEQYKSLQPENPNDPLSPKPLFNAATMTAVQPGSTFKMISALTALEKGLDPYYSIEDKGHIDIGGFPFGNWLWNISRQTQGFENVVTALRDSNNYYFYCISVGYNYATNENIPMGDMEKGQAILDMASKFGLGRKTGVEIYEIPGRIPDPKYNLNMQTEALRNDITNGLKNSFKDITYNSNEEEYKKRIDTIVSWMNENPPRAEIIKRLAKLNMKSSELEPTADLVKYTYFRNAEWTTGDIFNMAIGQGDHLYTPIAMANYISAIANGGYLNRVSVVDRLLDKTTNNIKYFDDERTIIPLKNRENLEYVKRGMIDVSDEGTAKAIFEGFPVKVAAKTGTAETQGKIPTKDEVNYYLSHLADYGVNKTDVMNMVKKLKSESKVEHKEEFYIKSAILTLNPNMTIDKLDRFKETYGDFSWFVAYAPYDNPQIAVVTLLFQGGSGGHAGPATRDVIAQYMGLNDDKEVKLEDEKDKLKIKVEQTKDNPNKIRNFQLPEREVQKPKPIQIEPQFDELESLDAKNKQLSQEKKEKKKEKKKEEDEEKPKQQQEEEKENKPPEEEKPKPKQEEEKPKEPIKPQQSQPLEETQENDNTQVQQEASDSPIF